MTSKHLYNMKKLYIIIAVTIITFGGWWIYSSQSKQSFSTNISSTTGWEQWGHDPLNTCLIT